MSDKSDFDIVKQCLDGDTEAFSVLVERYKKLIYSVVYNIINDRQEIGDVTQEVFLRIYKALDRYNPEYKFSTWSVKIATNLCLDIKRKKRPDSIPIEEIIGASSGGDTPEACYIRKESYKSIHDAVYSLPDKYRIPITLYHQNGLSYEEITSVLNEPMTIVKNRIYRGRIMLREKLQDGKEKVL